MANKYICTGKGFVKGTTFDRNHPDIKERWTPIVVYTNTLRDAKVFTSAHIAKFIEKHNIEGFVYSPWSEEPIRDLWRVVLKEQIKYDEGYTNRRTLSKWEAVRATMVSESDVKWLLTKKNLKEGLLTEEEAKLLAEKKNKELIDFLNG